MNFLTRAFSETDGTPSSQRLLLLVILVFTLNLISCAFLKEGHLPVIPDSLADMIKWMFCFVAGGIQVGKLAQAFGQKNGAADGSKSA